MSAQDLPDNEADWRHILSPAQFHILRQAGTEPPFSSPLNQEKQQGVYACAGCGQELFHASMKFDSGTGWPSFFSVIEGRVATRLDLHLSTPRTEYHCARCGGHQGHLFEDGPSPTGLRYCNNGVGLLFIPMTDRLPIHQDY
ncbi:MAG: peptide-methionine (R)-S-oxide reductase MsrB [Magnetococcus sp. YQC-3]